MPVNVNDKIAKLGPVQRKKVEARAARVIKEEMKLRQQQPSLGRPRLGSNRSC